MKIYKMSGAGVHYQDDVYVAVDENENVVGWIPACLMFGDPAAWDVSVFQHVECPNVHFCFSGREAIAII